ncbi:MAG: PorT family protein [Bacteroidetes bacterium]|jgi:hypothetical protein|nr:PorT family protein [Bacteroidota bacterium]MDF1865453.1 porin family protein [Saprospiraceae bacterium]
MKFLFRNFTFIFAFILIATTSQAQINFGLRAGINLANQAFEQDGLTIEPDANLGLTVGVLADIGISDNLSIQPEIDFIQKGMQLEFEFFGETTKSKQTWNYVEIPVLVKYKFGTDAVKAAVMAGPSFGYALSAKDETDGVETDLDFDDNDGVKRGDFGLNVGGMVGFGNLFIDLRYQIGLANIADDSDVTVNNKGFIIAVGCMFGGQ